MQTNFKGFLKEYEEWSSKKTSDKLITNIGNTKKYFTTLFLKTDVYIINYKEVRLLLMKHKLRYI